MILPDSFFWHFIYQVVDLVMHKITDEPLHHIEINSLENINPSINPRFQPVNRTKCSRKENSFWLHKQINLSTNGIRTQSISA
jgi:hypothetical protein